MRFKGKDFEGLSGAISEYSHLYLVDTTLLLALGALLCTCPTYPGMSSPENFACLQ
jgi:hypothetical protein